MAPVKNYFYSFVMRFIRSVVFASFLSAIVMFMDSFIFPGLLGELKNYVYVFLGIAAVECMMQPEPDSLLRKYYTGVAEHLARTFGPNDSLEALFMNRPNIIVFCKENLVELKAKAIASHNTSFIAFLEKIDKTPIEMTSEMLNPFTDSMVSDASKAMRSLALLLTLGDVEVIKSICPNTVQQIKHNASDIIALVCSEKDTAVKNQNVRLLAGILGISITKLNEMFLATSLNTLPLVDLSNAGVNHGAQLLESTLEDMDRLSRASGLGPLLPATGGLPGGVEDGKAKHYSPHAFWNVTPDSERAAEMVVEQEMKARETKPTSNNNADGGGSKKDGSSSWFSSFSWKKVAIFTICTAAGGAAAYLFGPSFFSATKETLRDIIKNLPSTTGKTTL